ncbi:ead/Ea22-like family protein [Klebsiella pneumoniae]|uniref:ead/Ea22-like family protein n=1 Tax=Klebsiella pneumoniae TaxID=573 RepID=UPI003B9F90F7
MTDITELAHREKFEAWWERTQHNGNPPRFGWSHWRDGEGYKVDDDNSELDGMWSAWKAAGAELVEELEKAQQLATQQGNIACALFDEVTAQRQRIAELENNEIQEEGNQFLVVRHPGKVPVIKHPVGELEDYLRQIFKADPLAKIDIVTHRYYGVGGQFVKDADEYLHEMSIKVEAE